MTPKEKAEELVEKYANIDNNCNNFAYDKACAIIAVDEILKTFPNINGIAVYKDHVVDIEYWQQVKEQIEML